MKISNQQIQFDRAAKTASLTHKDKARETLQKIAADLVSDKGAIKSGYLRISASGNEVDVKAGFMGSGATAATRLVQEMVQDAYGDQARKALDAYLANDSKGRGIGTVSFVKLLQAMERQEADSAPASDLIDKINSAKDTKKGRLGSESLIPRDASWNTKFELAEKSGQTDSFTAQARYHALTAIEFIKTISAADLELINKEAGALYRAVYDDPSILDSSKSNEDREQLLQPHADALTAKLVNDRLRNFDGASDASELNEDNRLIFDRVATSLRDQQEAGKQKDLQTLADPQARQALQRVLVEGKKAGLSLDALLLLPRGTNHQLVSRAGLLDVHTIVDKLIKREGLTPDEFLKAEILFGKLDIPQEARARDGARESV